VDQAIASFRKAIELDPKDTRGHTNLGGVFCDVKRDYDAGGTMRSSSVIRLIHDLADPDPLVRVDALAA
jgi:hypothetical protein